MSLDQEPSNKWRYFFMGQQATMRGGTALEWLLKKYGLAVPVGFAKQ